MLLSGSKTATGCPRAGRAQQRRSLQSRTVELIRRNRSSVADASEATARHRMRHMRDRVTRRIAFHHAEAAGCLLVAPLPQQPVHLDSASCERPTPEEPRLDLSAVSTLLKSAPLPPPGGTAASEASVTTSNSLPLEAPRPPSEDSTGVLARPARASRTSQAAQRRATATAVASLLS